MTVEIAQDSAGHAMQPEDTPELRALYKAFQDNHLNPLWTQTGDLMPEHPKPKAVAHVWKWRELLPLAKKSGELVPVGRGGERRRIHKLDVGFGDMRLSCLRSLEAEVISQVLDDLGLDRAMTVKMKLIGFF